ncbi:helix-turn-helix transcriptional regulator [Aquimarina sp. AU474]|uniref:ArsR/SmtB family transcription factor n=1 Tax=Aquimarina sp. AU474 TaxID=2108529 RepID=UPI000D68AC61|nr:metalloregulator ArsR/SmtB family transcription factor [Aquimarina sp. AU474]
MEARRDVFQAIADPTRRKIIGLLADSSKNLNSISENFNMSRQAVSLHIKILQECDLIVVQQKGRERICEVQLEKLNEVYEWTDQFRTFWTNKLHALKKVVEQPNDHIDSPKKL